MMRKYPVGGIILTVALLLPGCTGVPEGLRPVTGFELQRYLGTWYEIARLDHSFERNLSRVSATYTLDAKGDIRVVNRGYDTQKGQWKSIEGLARTISGDTVGSLKVSFFGPFYGGYHIIDLDQENYRYAMVVGPKRSYFWILARDIPMEEALLQSLLAKAARMGIDVSDIIRVEHQHPGEGG